VMTAHATPAPVTGVPADGDPAAASLQSPDDVAAALSGTGYLPDAALSTAVFLAARLARPLLLEGEAGVGKTSLAEALAQIKGSELIRLQCYEGIDAAQALYDWDFPRQVLHLRALQALRPVAEDGPADPSALAAVEDELYSERFLLARPVLAALRTPNAVLLIDEIDRADDEFEAFLLEVLADPGTRPGGGGRAAAGGDHLQPDPRGSRRAQAAMSVPLVGASRAASRGGDPATAAAGDRRGVGP